MPGWHETPPPALHGADQDPVGTLRKLRREALAGPLGYYERKEVLDAIHGDPGDECDQPCCNPEEAA